MTIRERNHVLQAGHFFMVLLMLSLLLTTIACNQAPSHQSAKQPSISSTTSQKKQMGPYVTPAPLPSPTLTAQALHGPTNFQLSNSFKYSLANGTTTDNGGTVTQLDAPTIETAITNELKRFLFVVDNNNTVKVYTPGATAPISTLVTQQSDGSTAIQYTQIVNSVTTKFNSAIARDHMTIEYERQYSSGASANDPLAMTGSDVSVALTTTVKWISASEIPTAPTQGVSHITNSGAVELVWKAGQHVQKYNIYRIIPSINQQYQLLQSVAATSYLDSSALAIKNAKQTQGIAYAIFSVGSTGVENPSDEVISVATK